MESTTPATVVDRPQRTATGTGRAHVVAPTAGAATKAARVRVGLLAGDLLATPSTDDDTTGLPPRGAPV